MSKPDSKRKGPCRNVRAWRESIKMVHVSQWGMIAEGERRREEGRGKR